MVANLNSQGGNGEGGVRVWVAFGEEERVKIMFFTLKTFL